MTHSVNNDVQVLEMSKKFIYGIQIDQILLNEYQINIPVSAHN